jgi:hypothetical protein
VIGRACGTHEGEKQVNISRTSRKESPGRPRRKWKDIIKVDLK